MASFSKKETREKRKEEREEERRERLFFTSFSPLVSRLSSLFSRL
jgi:hypothetical protein